MAKPENAASAAAPGPETQEAPATTSVVEEILQKAYPPSRRERARDLITDFVSEVLKGTMTVSADAEAAINKRIAKIDELLSAQLNEILHDPKFQKMESSWRGLKYLLDQSETSDKLKIKVLNTTKKDLLKDLDSEFDQSALFQKVYEQEYGMFGGAPYASLIGDFEFGTNPEDMELLQKIAKVAAAAHAPFLSAASPEMLDIESFSKLGSIRDVAKVFDSVEYAKWKSFRASEDSRYVGLCLPHILMRLPYGGPKGKSIEAFKYEEGVDGRDHSKYLWGNAAYALAARLTDAFAQYGWCTAIRGPEGGGRVSNLPTHTFTSDDGDVALKCPTEVAIPERRDRELSDQGLIPLVHCKDTDYAAFFSVQSAQKPALYNTESATANARISAQLPYIFAVSRFAHYMKAMMLDKIGTTKSRREVESDLKDWIRQYVAAGDNLGQVIKAQRPLSDAQIEVVDIPGKPGAYRAVAFLKPHFQLDEIAISLRLVADLPGGAK